MNSVFHTYVHSYVEDLKRTLDEFDRDVLQKVLDLLVQARRDDRHIFLLGNGGSAAAASHMACDLGKGTIDFDAPDFRRFRVTSLADNVALLTALGNDISFNEVFVEPLRAHLRPGDVVVAISASGNSPNVIAALAFARTNGATTVGLLGFGGGTARQLVDLALVVSSRNYGIAEDFHTIAQHILTQCLRRALAANAARPMLFLDRDGIVNERAAPHHYVTRWDDFRFIPGIVDTLRQAQALGYGLVVLTNQQCVGKGLITAADVAGIHTAMVKELAAQGVAIDGVHTCPHLESDRCGCRKPQPGLIYRALNETNYMVDVPGSFLLGDSETDVLAGRAAGLQSILLAPAGTSRSASAAAHTISVPSESRPNPGFGASSDLVMSSASAIRASSAHGSAGNGPKPKVVLYWEGNTDGTIGGSQIFMFDLITHLDRRQFHPIAGFAQENPIVDRFREVGVETLVYQKGQPLDVRKALGTATAWRRMLLLLLLPFQKALNFLTRFVVPTIRHAVYLRRRGVDLIDLNNSIIRNHEWMMASLLAGVKCITHEAGINDHYPRSARFFHRRMRAVICCSHAIAANMKKHGLDHARLPVIHSCVSSARMQVNEPAEKVRQRLNLPPDGPVIGMVGNIKGWKGQETVVRATALLAARHPRLVCLLVGKVGLGDEPFYEKLQRLCSELGIADRVVFAGYQQTPADFMNVMDVVIHASVHPEPFGMVNLEAMGLGKPVVATNIGGPVEVFENGVSGFLIEPGVPERLAEAVDRLLTNPKWAREIGAAARRRRETHFRLENTVDKTQAVYRDVLDVPAASAVPAHEPRSAPDRARHS